MMSTYHLPKFMLFAFLPTVISITVSTKYGDIEGFQVSYSSASGPFKSVSKFLGVPFAAPPTGRFRFKAPQPVKGWKPAVKEQPRSQGFSPPRRGWAGKDPGIGRSRDFQTPRKVGCNKLACNNACK